VRHFLSLKDYTKDELLEIIDLSIKIKAETKRKEFKPYLEKQTLGMIFEKSSTRTRVSFETGIYQLGGVGLFLSSNDLQIGRGEPIVDTANVISRMVDMVMIRTYSHQTLEEFAAHSKVPVINGLSDDYHPVQLMADYQTIVEQGKESNLVAAYIGDGNNMTNSWIMLAAKLGFELRVATPKGYEVSDEMVNIGEEIAKESGAKIIYTHDPKEAAKGATVITTDTWVSMGQEDEKEQRIKDFDGFIVDDTLMQLGNDAIFLHCLPAYRGYEVSESVIDGAASYIYDEAENRLHAQKAIMVWLDQKRD
jgi:ornithine carbamoyltransferase